MRESVTITPYRTSELQMIHKIIEG